MSNDEYIAEVRKRVELHRQYWRRFQEMVADLELPLLYPMLNNPYLCFALPDERFHIAAVLPILEPGIRVEFSIKGRTRHELFQHFLDKKNEVEAELSECGTIEWCPASIPKGEQCQIAVVDPEADPGDESAWLEQHRWLHTNLHRFKQVFLPWIEGLER